MDDELHEKGYSVVIDIAHLMIAEYEDKLSRLTMFLGDKSR
jgi:hypothetical protein